MRTTQLLSAAAWTALALATAIADDAASLRVTRDDTTVTVVADGVPRMTYRFADVPFKPCVKTLCTPSGVNVLRDSPHDHIHHHALMYAIAVDGTSFWIEWPKDKPGSQIDRGIRTASRTADGAATVTLEETLDWVNFEKQPLMTERRTIRLDRAKDVKPTLLTWQTELKPAEGKPSVKLGGSHYYGLGMRFVESMDKGGRFFNAANAEGEVVRGSERLTPTKWIAYTAAVDGKPVTVAMFDHPTNPRHPARMFTMTAPFAYISATLNLWKEPLALEAGNPLSLRYGVAVWDGEATAEDVEEAYVRWTK
jgi:hypothetical protein